MANQKPVINYDSCYGCKACMYNCPVSVIELDHPVTRRGMFRELPAIVDEANCIGCGLCARMCPVEAIDMVKTEPAEGKKAVYVDFELPIRIDPNKCKGCTACKKVCPANAIEGKVKVPHVVDEAACLKCGLCMEKCKFDAIYNTDAPVPELIKKEEPKAEGPAFDPDKPLKILEDKCKGCTACKKVCPNDAIEGELKAVHTIVQDKCIRCGACLEKCKLGAIVQE